MNITARRKTRHFHLKKIFDIRLQNRCQWRIVSGVTANKRVDDLNANLNKRIDDLRTLSIAILFLCVLGIVAHIVKAFFLN